MVDFKLVKHEKIMETDTRNNAKLTSFSGVNKVFLIDWYRAPNGDAGDLIIALPR
jgi:hypothetical protein